MLTYFGNTVQIELFSSYLIIELQDYLVQFVPAHPEVDLVVFLDQLEKLPGEIVYPEGVIPFQEIRTFLEDARFV